MPKVFIYCVLVSAIAEVFCLPTNPPSGEGRALYQFASIISHITGRNPLDYNNYGCHCGWGSKGPNVVDAVDQCCVAHDNCYNSASYDYDFVTNDVQCTDPPGTDNRQACECDRTAALCFRSSSYNEAYKNYPADQC